MLSVCRQVKRRLSTRGRTQLDRVCQIPLTDSHSTASWLPTLARIPLSTRRKVDLPSNWLQAVSKAMGSSTRSSSSNPMHRTWTVLRRTPFSPALPNSYPELIINKFRISRLKAVGSSRQHRTLSRKQCAASSYSAT